ncbi:MAG: ABC transporter permease, partial [Lachnospiraceae bacterium]|nr:ABC transporter permease [Lachnospiraceae bacterium]
MKVKSTSAKIGDWIFVFICVIISLICIIPMLNLAAKSLSSTQHLIRHEVFLLPKGLNFEAYGTVLSDPKYQRAFIWITFLTLVCTLLSLTMTALCAYPLIFPALKGRGAVNVFITITMFFNAGTIPN